MRTPTRVGADIGKSVERINVNDETAQQPGCESRSNAVLFAAAALPQSTMRDLVEANTHETGSASASHASYKVS